MTSDYFGLNDCIPEESWALNVIIWNEFYQGYKYAIPKNAPDQRGSSVKINLFVEAIHASNIVTSMSHSRFLIFIRKVVFKWY